jgi:hypothetical protein
MSTEMDFKSLWNKEGTSDIPDTKELLEKAGNLKKITRRKLIRLNLLLLATAVFIIYIGFNIDNEKLTTKIGIALIAVAIVSYLAVYNQLMPLLFKSDMEMSSHEYLNQMIRIKRKQDFLNKVMINVYFALLSVGMFLYLLQFTIHATVIGNVLTYGLTFGWIGFSWFYLRPRGIRKKQQPLLEMITKLKAVDEQLEGE